MFINTKIVIDMETGAVVERDGYEYCGEVAECKGDTKTQDNQLNLQNSLQQQQLAKQNANLDTVNNSLSPYLTQQGQGFTPQQLALMNSQAIDQNSAQYGGAGNQLRQQLLARGETGQGPASGTFAAGNSALLSGKASDFANALRTNALANAQQGLTNRFNADSIMSGNAQTLAGNVGTFGSGANSALGALTQKQIADQQNSFMANLSRGLGAGLGSGLGGGLSTGLTGGLGTALSTVGKGNYGW
jgi:hypothetical protein